MVICKIDGQIVESKYLALLLDGKNGEVGELVGQ
jgi:hypothetical protein